MYNSIFDCIHTHSHITYTHVICSHSKQNQRTLVLPYPIVPYPQKCNHCSDFYSPVLDLYVLALHLNGIIKYVMLCVCHLSVNIISMRFTHVGMYINSSLFFIAQYYFITRIYHSLLSCVDRLLGYFQLFGYYE